MSRPNDPETSATASPMWPGSYRNAPDDSSMTMRDWRASEASEPYIDARPWKVEISESSEDSFRIEAICPDGARRQVWMEIQDGKLVIHAYDPDHEEPVNLRIGKTGVTIDSDRDNWRQRHCDSRRCDGIELLLRQLAGMTLPEEEYRDAGCSSVEDYIADLDDDRLCGEYETFMEMVRAARKIPG